MQHNAFRDDEVHVLSRKCDTCIFRPGDLMDLGPDRKEQFVAENLADEAVVVCHETYAPRDSAVCRGFYDVHRREVPALRLAAAFNIITFDDPPPRGAPVYPCCTHCERDCAGKHAGPCIDCTNGRR